MRRLSIVGVGSLLLGLPALSLFGCDDSPTGTSTVEATLDSTAPDEFTDEGGHIFRKTKRAVIATQSAFKTPAAAQESKGPNGERVLTYPPGDNTDLAKLSVAEIAQLLRGRAFHRGFEYQEVELPTQLAQKVRDGLDRGTPPPTTLAHPVALAIEGSAAKEDDTQRYIIGGDNRSYAGGNRNFPNSTQVFLGNCSGSMIGSRMMASAAHCFFENGTWTIPASVTAAADNGGNPAPFGNWSNFTVVLPTGWTGNQWGIDFARVAFTTRRGDATGWLGTGDDSAGVSEMVGYPGDKPRPQMWIKAGSVTSVSSNRRKHDLDIVGGDSGAALYKQGQFIMNGIQSTENWSQTCFAWICGSKSYWNEATRWTSTLHTFFAASGVWPD